MIRRFVNRLLGRRFGEPSPGQQLAALSAHARIVDASTDRERARLVAKQMRDAMPGRDWRVAL